MQSTCKARAVHSNMHSDIVSEWGHRIDEWKSEEKQCEGLDREEKMCALCVMRSLALLRSKICTWVRDTFFRYYIILPTCEQAT